MLTTALLGLITPGAFCFQASAQTAKSQATPSAIHVSIEFVVTFAKGSSEFTKTHKEALATLMQKLKDRSQKIEQIHVAAWADKSPDATAEGRKLAASRMNAIQDHLEGELAQSYVETFNMTERSTWFAKAMNANAKDIRKMFSQKGAPQNVTPEDFAIVRSKGGPMKAVLLIEIESPASMSRDQ